MPNLLLRRNSVVAAYPDMFRVILTMDDGYELDVGGINRDSAAHQREFWAWSVPGANGQEPTLDEAMAAFRAEWPTVTPDTIARIRHDQEWTANKYALWGAGYRNQIGRGPVKCRCGEMFDPIDHDQTMKHIGHITGRAPGTDR
jgi:hypothetical protein